ncbi:hypothetical protein EDB80DRAFT_691326 [Ilyonectria destructans]|nr:hypothetical protein EDB80DRAFT_691326 [Ilyonectria destructans]
MYSMLLFSCATLVSACTSKYGLWIPEWGQSFNSVVDELDLSSYNEIQDFNPDVEDLDFIYVGSTYSVPRVSATSGAKWSEDCPPFLLLNNQRSSSIDVLSISITTTRTETVTGTAEDTWSRSRTGAAYTLTSKDEASTASTMTRVDESLSLSTSAKSWKSSSTSEPSTIEPTCYNSSTHEKFSVGVKERDHLAVRFCGSDGVNGKVMKKGDGTYIMKYLDDSDGAQLLAYGWAGNCNEDEQPITTSQGTCHLALRAIGRACTYGGFTVVGCVKYRFWFEG